MSRAFKLSIPLDELWEPGDPPDSTKRLRQWAQKNVLAGIRYVLKEARLSRPGQDGAEIHLGRLDSCTRLPHRQPNDKTAIVLFVSMIEDGVAISLDRLVRNYIDEHLDEGQDEETRDTLKRAADDFERAARALRRAEAKCSKREIKK